MSKDLFFKGLTYLIMLLAAAAVMFAYIGTLQLQTEVMRQQSVVRCQLVHANEFQEAIATRDNANRVIREAQISLLEEAVSTENTDAATIQENILALKRANDVILAHPLPRVNFCDGVY